MLRLCLAGPFLEPFLQSEELLLAPANLIAQLSPQLGLASGSKLRYTPALLPSRMVREPVPCGLSADTQRCGYFLPGNGAFKVNRDTATI